MSLRFCPSGTKLSLRDKIVETNFVHKGQKFVPKGQNSVPMCVGTKFVPTCVGTNFRMTDSSVPPRLRSPIRWTSSSITSLMLERSRDLVYYVHYEEHDRRLVEWVPLSRFDLETTRTRSRRRGRASDRRRTKRPPWPT